MMFSMKRIIIVVFLLFAAAWNVCGQDISSAPSSAPSLAPSASIAPSSITFPTTAPAPMTSPPVSSDCLGQSCTSDEDCSCFPGLLCRARNVGGTTEQRCSARQKTNKQKLSGPGVGGAGGRAPRTRGSTV